LLKYLLTGPYVFQRSKLIMHQRRAGIIKILNACAAWQIDLAGLRRFGPCSSVTQRTSTPSLARSMLNGVRSTSKDAIWMLVYGIDFFDQALLIEFPPFCRILMLISREQTPPVQRPFGDDCACWRDSG
jgi:hypothetical protein